MGEIIIQKVIIILFGKDFFLLFPDIFFLNTYLPTYLILNSVGSTPKIKNFNTNV